MINWYGCFRSSLYIFLCNLLCNLSRNKLQGPWVLSMYTQKNLRKKLLRFYSMCTEFILFLRLRKHQKKKSRYALHGNSRLIGNEAASLEGRWCMWSIYWMRIKQSYPEIYIEGRGFQASFDFYGSLCTENTIGRCESCISKLRCAQNYTEPINDTARMACENLT